jgi:hypothetical protein
MATQVEHMGHTIYFDESTENWRVRIGDSHVVDPSLKKVKEKIGKIMKPTQRRPAILVGGRWGSSEDDSLVTITSIDDRDYAWITDNKDKSRQKSSVTHLREDTPENRALSKQRKDIKKQITKLEAEFSALADRMARVELKADE